MKQLYILFFIFLLLSCKSKDNVSRSFDREIYSPENSSNFSIDEDTESSEILITVNDPWQGAENIGRKLLITDDKNIPEDFDGEILKGKAERIICMSSTHIAMLDALDALDKIVGVSGKNYISNPKLLADDSFIPDVGYEGNVDYEAIVAANPDLVLLFSINGASGMELKLRELGIPYLYIGDYLEENPLGKVEWIIPVAQVIGEREKGIEIYNEIKNNYNSLKEKVAQDNLERPKIMVNAPFADSWFMPSSKSYVAYMINDAGAEYIYKKNTGNSTFPIDLEAALQLVTHADYWINIGNVDSMDELKSSFPKFVNADCVVKGNVYNNNLKSSPGGGNDCYESGAVRQDLILRDLIKIFHPEMVTEDFTYYKKLE